MRLIFKTDMFIVQSKAYLDVKIVFGRIPYLLVPESKEMLERSFYGNEHPTIHSGPGFICHGISDTENCFRF